MHQPPACTAILLIAHGSRQQAANDDLRELAGRVAEQGTYTIVQPCFLELAEPGLLAGGDRCVELGATRVLMIPYFLAAGVHLRRDLTAARDELNGAAPGGRLLPRIAPGAAFTARSTGCGTDPRARPASPRLQKGSRTLKRRTPKKGDPKKGGHSEYRQL